ncbi:hypothetical protein G6F68_021388 [Rhizopus microsporus]|nr:hypothetical protein G6F31_020553 [Rhizopus arrhizus]KAG1219583.1 hypothetical protein G6F68_021388 [Rhizopus microsporus]
MVIPCADLPQQRWCSYDGLSFTLPRIGHVKDHEVRVAAYRRGRAVEPIRPRRLRCGAGRRHRHGADEQGPAGHPWQGRADDRRRLPARRGRSCPPT